VSRGRDKSSEEEKAYTYEPKISNKTKKKYSRNINWEWKRAMYLPRQLGEDQDVLIGKT